MELYWNHNFKQNQNILIKGDIMKNLQFNYINEAGLGKILAIGGGLAGAAIAGHEFMNDVHQGEQINPMIDPNASADNTVKSLGAAMKIPLYGLGGAAAGGIAGGIIGLGSGGPKRQMRPMNQYRRR